MTEKLYAERDIEALGDHHIAHLYAMSGEMLHAKSAIAAELAHRDIRIKELEQEIGLTKISLEHKTTLLESCETALENDKRCPLYVNYEKSCETLKARKAELRT